MAFLDILSSLGDVADAGANRTWMASLVRQGLTEGLSANAMLGAIKTAGLGIRRQSFLQLTGEVRASMAREDQWATMPYDQVPGPELMQEWTGGRAETYLYRLSKLVRRTVGGELTVERQGFNVLTRSPIAPNDAVAIALTQHEETHPETTTVGELFGIELSGIYHQLGSAA